jgi:hypothetical protein
MLSSSSFFLFPFSFFLDPAPHSATSLEKLHGAFVSLGRRTTAECTKVATPAGLRIRLSRIETIFPGRQLANHF